ncbi:MAG: methyltransferase domain-containing protein [Verrucomicrobiota bacterium]
MTAGEVSSKRLHVGCGTDIREGYVNVDVVKLPGVDVVCDLNRLPWPFESDTFVEVVAHHFLEHTEDVVAVLNEMWRVCRQGALIKIRVPYFASFLAFKDLTHRHVFTYDSFDNWDIANFETGRYVTHFGVPMRFRIRQRRILMFSKAPGMLYYLATGVFLLPLLVINLMPRLYERFFFFYLPATNICYELEVVKPRA